MAGISINLAGNFTKLDELKDKAQKTSASIKSAFGSNLGKAMFGGISVAAAAAFAGVVAAMKSAIQAGGELSDMMARTGADGAKLVVLQRAFENAGMAASSVPQVLNKMQKALAGVNEDGQETGNAFAKLGLSVGTLMAMDPAAAFRATSEAIARLPDPAQRAAAAMELFGRSGGELLVLMTDTTAFSAAEEQVGSLAQTLADNAAQLDAVADALELLDVKMQQVGVELAVALMPQLTAFANWMNETDFSSVGAGLGDMAEKIISFAQGIADVVKYIPAFMVLDKLANAAFGGDADPVKAKEKAKREIDALMESQGWTGKGTGKSDSEAAAEKAANIANPFADARDQSKRDAEKQAEKAAEKAAKDAEKKADSDKKASEERARSRAAAMEEYNLESAMLSARLKGDAQKLAALEREKKIREEIDRLTRAGFTADEARRPAEAKVDAEKKAAEQEQARKDAEDEKKKIQETLQGKLADVQGRIEGQEFQSTVGAVSSMQRIGGGGGAVSSGLDYARQSADLQREANNYLRQLIDLNRPELDA
jgi:hypothetical protein